MFEEAKWICAKEDNEEGSVIIRKKFIGLRGAKKAMLKICALGYGVAKINGKDVTQDVLTTPFTEFSKRALYNEYDVTALLLEGENVLTVEIGNGWYNPVGSTWDYEKAPWRDKKKLIFELSIEYEEATKTIVSDMDCKSESGAVIFNHLREGEIFDARLYNEKVQRADFDDSAMQGVAFCNPPGGIIDKAEIPPIRERKILKGKEIKNGIYDFGENTSGYAHISLGGAKRGDEIKLIYAEIFDGEDIDAEHFNHFKNHMGHVDTYIASGKAREEWHPHFVYHGFRYIKVENAPKDFEIEARVVYTDFDIVGKFSCNDEMLNKIHEASMRSTLTNYHSIPTDCPHREQNGWTGDAALSCEQALMNFDMTAAYKKWMNDFKDVQRPNGQLPGIVPTGGWGYNWGSGPAWDAAMFCIPWNVYNLTGDCSLIKQMYPNMKLYMEYINARAVSFIADFGLGDWCPPDDNRVCPNNVTDTAYYYYFAKTMEKCAEIMGDGGAEYKETALRVRAAWRERFMNDKSLRIYQTYYACGIYFGLFDEEEKAEMAKRLAALIKENDYHIDCGILGTKYIFTALSENGYIELLYKMITNPTYPSYAYWINEGMTTFGEKWNMTCSRNHHMYSEVDHWFYKYLGGITFKRGEAFVSPMLLKEVSEVEASCRGVRVSRKGNEVKVLLPYGGTVKIGGKEEKKKAGEYVFKI